MKYKSAEMIEQLGYEISVKRSGDGWVDISLLENGEQAGVTKCRTNAESVDKIRARIAGEIPIKPGTYLSGALDNLAEKAEAKQFAANMYEYNNSSIDTNMSKALDNIFERIIEKNTQSSKPNEPEHFYIIHAKSVDLTNGKPVLFSNEFVGTERDFNEYKSKYGKKPMMESEIVSVEIFAPEFRDTHRKIEQVLRAYKAGTGDRNQMHESLKTLNEEGLKRLVDRLKDNGIDPKKFESEIKGQKPNKLKPKM